MELHRHKRQCSWGYHINDFDPNFDTVPSLLLAMSIRDHDPSSKVFTGSSDMEAEKGDFTVSDSDSSHHALQRQLKNRHIAMIR